MISDEAQLATVAIVDQTRIMRKPNSYVRIGRVTIIQLSSSHYVHCVEKGSLDDVQVLKLKPSLNPDKHSHRYDPAVFTHV